MKNMMFKAAIAGVATTVGFATVNLDAAHAITFNFSDPAPRERQSSFSFEEGGLELTVTGFLGDSPRLVAQTPFGLGVRSRFFDTDQTDGSFFGRDESLLFDFGDHIVKLVSATFGAVGSNDDFNLLVDGTQLLDDADINGLGIGTFDFSGLSGFSGSEFGFLADGGSDGWYVKSLTVKKVAVPEPAAMLGLGAVAAAGMLAQKKSRKETA